MSVTLVSAMTDDRVIGVDGDMPWNIPAELKHFKKETLGKVLVMGRKTFDSIGRPLPGRTTIVITRDPQWCYSDDVLVAHSVEEALEKAGDRDVVIAGGGEIYRQAMPFVDVAVLSVVDMKVEEGDTFFPELPEGFVLVSRTQDVSGAPFRVDRYVRENL